MRELRGNFQGYARPHSIWPTRLMAYELNTVSVAYLGQFEERYHLEASRVGEQVPRP